MKGYVLTIDVMFGAILAIFLIVATFSFMQGSYTGGIGEISMKRLATDIIAVLDYNGTLSTLDSGIISAGLDDLLPPNMEMGINITVYDYNLVPVSEIDINYATNKSRYAGRWGFPVFITSRTDSMAMVDYWVAFR